MAKSTAAIDWPIYFKDRLMVGDASSSVGVATLWQPKENVAEALPKSAYSVCGQLYTKRGINPLIRNILANPRIRHLVICGPDRQGSGAALLKFFSHGVKGGRVVGDQEALIDPELPAAALALVRQSIFVHNMTNQPLDKVCDFVQKLPSEQPFGKPRIYPENKTELKGGFPSDLSVFKIRRDDIGDAWLDVLKTVLRFGVDTPGMYGKVKQVHNLTVVIERENTRSPKLPSYLNLNQNSLNKYYRGFFSQNQDAAEAYTYGERIFAWGKGIDQQALMVQKLKQFPYDRGALAVLWDAAKDNFPPKNTQAQFLGQTKGWKAPCLVLIMAQCLNDKLHLTAVFRSNDLFGAWVLNAFALRRFQEKLACQINREVGSLTTISHAAEIYEADWDAAAKIVKQNDTLARTCVLDPRSYYTVKVVGSEIVVDFFTPDGSAKLETFSISGKKPKCARDMCAQILKELLISDLGAACDLGRQLAKAESAVKLGLKFEQDQPLKPYDQKRRPNR
ncbi:hypothetical protein KJ605_02415 [Patescibacteria group bacterium]|nr:hypothetical protein [Patescibacteria group bacterium]MBU1970603.1 hypothetical protein [Patescibacteria group bacterium]